MSVTVILNGASYTIPTTNEGDWDEDVTDYLEDICNVLNGTFQTVTGNGSVTVDFNAGRNVRLNLTGNTTLSFSNPRGGRPCYFYIRKQGGYGITWPAAVKWRGGSPPTLTIGGSSGSPKRDVVCLQYEPTDAIYLGEFATGFA